MRFFKKVVKSTSKSSFSGGYVKRSLARSCQGAPPKYRRLGDGDVREKKFKKATSKVPGIRLVELLIASIEIIHCSTVIVLINLYC